MDPGSLDPGAALMIGSHYMVGWYRLRESHVVFGHTLGFKKKNYSRRAFGVLTGSRQEEKQEIEISYVAPEENIGARAITVKVAA